MSRAQRIQNLAYALIQAGIRPGDRVAVIAPNWCVLQLLSMTFQLTLPLVKAPSLQVDSNPTPFVVSISIFCLDAHHGVIAARAVLTPINTRLKTTEVAYILEHSGASLILVDFEYTHLVPQDTKVPVIVSKDTGRDGDPYETFLTEGRAFSQGRSWGGLDAEPDENAGAVLCYT